MKNKIVHKSWEKTFSYFSGRKMNRLYLTPDINVILTRSLNDILGVAKFIVYLIWLLILNKNS